MSIAPPPLRQLPHCLALLITCSGCGRRVLRQPAGALLDLSVKQVAARASCASCGGRQASVEVLQRAPDMGVGRKDKAAQDAAKLKQWEEWVNA
jgi:hypothetical protein